MIIVDSNVLIYSESENAPEHSAALSRISDASKRGRLGVNVIIASETFHKLSGFFGRVEAAARISRTVTDPNFEYLEFTPSMVVKAMQLSRDFNIRINDALIAQQAIEMGASVLTDNTRDFGRIKAVRVIPLRSSS